METKIKNILIVIGIILAIVVLLLISVFIFSKNKDSQQLNIDKPQQIELVSENEKVIAAQLADLEELRKQDGQTEPITEEVAKQQLDELETLRANTLSEPEQKTQILTEEEIQAQLKQLEELQKNK